MTSFTVSIFKYEAGKENVPKMINKVLKEQYENKDSQKDYLIFVQSDIFNDAKNFDKVANDYCEHLHNWNLPFGYYSYYGRFNRVLPLAVNKPNPKFIINCKYGKADVTNQLAYGLLVLDVKKLCSKNIFLDENYPELFYLQDLAEKCYQNDLWISNCLFFDIHDSWNYFKSQKNEGYNIDFKKYATEKAEYNKIERKYHSINEFIELYKKVLYPEEVKVEGKSSAEKIEMIDINNL